MHHCATRATLGLVSTAAAAGPWAHSGHRERAAAELRRDPARSDLLIADIARTSVKTVTPMRRQLEAAGEIPVIPPGRAARAGRPIPGRPPVALEAAHAAIEAGARTAREIMDVTGLPYQVAWRALQRWPPPPPLRYRPPAVVFRMMEQPAVEMQLGGLCFVPNQRPVWTSDNADDRALAVRICKTCSVRVHFCGPWALRNIPPDDDAIYAAMDGARRAERRAAARPAVYLGRALPAADAGPDGLGRPVLHPPLAAAVDQ